MQVSTAIAFAALVFIEIVRCSRIVPSLSDALQRFMSGFADERDSGPVFTTHLALLLGMAMPVWLGRTGLNSGCRARPSNVSSGSGSIWDLNVDFQGLSWLLVSSSGMLCLGLGDSAASAIGVLYGRCETGESKCSVSL